MSPILEGPQSPSQPTRSAFRLLAIPSLALAFAAGFALASPRQPPPPPNVATPASCNALALPPGHPPIGRHGSLPEPALQLPPGHPPIEGRGLGALRSAPPLPPSFQEPSASDI
jgi:hypothetical protein